MKVRIKYSAIVGMEASLKAVESDGNALQYVKDQTEAVCLKAVERNGYALQYVLSFDLFSTISAKIEIKRTA